ncbi:MAG: DUF4395 domain-containing protein [Halobacteria archaeon]|nr:DUF4395 domain-containing protein [Halobacteria archaeon]
METPTGSEAHARDGSTKQEKMVDPRAPRFGQSITTSLLLVGIVFNQPVLVFTVAAILVIAAVSGWKLDIYAFLWRNLMVPIVGNPGEKEHASPHRFAKLIGATLTTLASIALLLGLTTLGYALAAIVVVAAGLAATTGLCLGCKMYNQVSYFRRLGVV